MPRVTLIQQVYNSRRYVPEVYKAMVAQTYKDIQIISQIVSDDGGCEDYIREHYPQVKILKPGYNIGFARGHNEIFQAEDSEFFQLVNPDLILQPDYVEEMLQDFTNNNVGAATGKLLRYDFEQNLRSNIIDTTGVIMSRSGRARDRGQHEIDLGQYDNQLTVIGVSGAGPMYRKSALEATKYRRPDGRFEYFDEDFHSYWEDVDLSLRLTNAGFMNRYVPAAVAFHGRTAGSSKKGYKDVAGFVKHHKKLAPRIRQLNAKNHIFLFIKNSPKFYWQFFVRELFYWGYVTVFEIRTLGVLPELFRQLPQMWSKRKFIRKQRKISQGEFERLLS